MRARPTRAGSWWIAWTCIALVAALVLPSTAGAHASLEGTRPANEAVTDTHPTTVSMTFSENVQGIDGGTKVFAPDGGRVDVGEAKLAGRELTIPVRTKAAGTYAVSWRVISSDGHPIHGAFVFHVERRSGDDVSRDKAERASEGSRVHDIAFGIARLGVLLGILGSAGGMAFVVVARRGGRPRWLHAFLLVGLASMLAAYVLDVSVATGRSVVEALDWAALRDHADSTYGRGTLVRIAVALACLTASTFVGRPSWRSARVRWAVLVPFAALAASLSISGHAVGDEAAALRLPLDVLHSLAAAVWLGGLVQLAAHVPLDHAGRRSVVRFSRMAFVSVVVLVVTGLYATWQEVGVSLDGLLDTTYGRLVLAKSLLLVAVLPLADANRRRNVPALASGATDARLRLRRLVRGELAVLVLVVVATAWLVQAIPARTALHPGFVEKTVQLGKGGSVQLVIDPAEAGTNEIHLYAFDESQLPDADVTELTLTASNEQLDLGPLELELEPSGPGHYTTSGATIPYAGSWQFAVAVRRGEFEEERARFTANIATKQAN